MNSSTRKIKTGILGAGQANIATNNQLPATLAAENIELVALCDINPAVNDYAMQHGVKAYTDYGAMLADSEIEMIQIATPDWLHCEQTERALAAGKHVALQKPPCLNPTESERLRKAASQNRSHLKILQNQRETVLSRTIKNLIDSGKIGELREMTIRCRGCRFPIQNLNSPYLKAECGGVWTHNGLHWLDEAFFYSGTLPETVHVFAAKNEQGAPQVLGEGPNYWSAIFKMGRVTFLFEYNTMLTGDGLPGGMHRSIIGSEGELRQDYGMREPILYRKGDETPKRCELTETNPGTKDDTVNSFRLALEKFARQILTGRKEPPMIEDSLALMDAIFAGSASAKENKLMRLGRVL
jgi:predicted dehydrogenase